MMKYNRVNIDGRGIFYRETGNADAPSLLLLHGFPTSSHMFRDLMPRLADRYHVVAPDLYVFDYGAPVGFRLALAHPERVTAIVSQNGNAYVEGLSQGWNPIQKYWKEPTPENRAALRDF